MSRPGPLILVGSGEFLPVMRDTDRFVAERLGGDGSTRVAVIPTASGLEPGMPARWAEMGVEHFQALGLPVTPAMIVTAEDAADPRWLAVLAETDFYYFSGGNPNYLVETFRGSPAWQIIRARHLAGAALAGCSAGAMMLGGATVRVRDVARGQPPAWVPALAMAPRLGILPHFDRMERSVGDGILAQVVAARPAGLNVVGIDEDTALVRIGPPETRADAAPRWRVMGRQAVRILDGANGTSVHPAGTDLALDEGTAES